MVYNAVAGDRSAIENLLLICQPRLSGYVKRRLPWHLRPIVATDDVLQEIYVRVFRDFHTFVPKPGSSAGDSFERWIYTVARHHLADILRVHLAMKRDRRRQAVPAEEGRTHSGDGIMNRLASEDPTPNTQLARREARAALAVALAGLKPDYRQALHLRFHEGLTVSQVAARMNRTVRSIHMLCYRGLRDLRVSLGRSSKFFSS